MQPRNGGTAVSRRSTYALLVLLASALTGCGYSAAQEEATNEPATVESVDGSGQARVVLTSDAAKRIGLRTQAIALQRVGGTLVVPGRVAARTGARSVDVRVVVTARTRKSVDSARPARILDGQEGLVAPLTRSPTEPPLADSLYYRLDGAGSVRAGERVRVQLPLRGGGVRKTVPYSAVIYWIDGGTWVYAETGARTFVREAIDIDGVDGDVAVLKSGPPAGTRVVTVGGEELLGTEFAIEGE
jgi:hypothetical protein